LQVICESGYSGCDHPKAIFWQGSRLTVKQIIKEWRSQDAKHYLVTTENGAHFELAFIETSGSWSIFEVSCSHNS
jgi:hypothetical protein